ncbi:MAG: DegT/DnrJ/EryC1/StrS family aminotransferase [Gemmobacter sp.]|nr:DegT/DnrJ/EryC1/StrS family aminotransferase [Gemmobacter sp.]
MEQFTGSFTQQEPIPEAAIEAAVAVMRAGRLHRYNTAPGEVAETALLEEEFAVSIGARYCLAVASGGYALACALRALGVQPGERVLTNAFTLAPVPGAIASLGAVPVFVGVTEGLVIDLDDLAAKADGVRVLLLSHMRGHICDMERLMALCETRGIAVVEDCAHTMGATWAGRPTGRWGVMGCFSTQTYKHLNSGEGGLLISDDTELMARAVLLSGSYMLYDRHRAAPPPEAFSGLRLSIPNISGRMDNLRAAILRPQLRDLAAQCARWNERYRVVERGLAATPGLALIERPGREGFVASSFQFLLPGWPAGAVHAVLARCAARGVELKWFGAPEPAGFTSRYDSWTYVPSAPMPATDRVLQGLIDMRLPLTFSLEDCALIARIIRAEVSAMYQAGLSPEGCVE